jgi:hypothetical protein
VEKGLETTKCCGHSTYAPYILWSRVSIRRMTLSEPGARGPGRAMSQKVLFPQRICCTTGVPRTTIRMESDVQNSRPGTLFGRRRLKRRIRRAIEIPMPFLGMGIIFGAVLFRPNSLQLQVLWVLSGILILEAGIWGLTNGLLPNERRYSALREEGDHFLGLIRILN